MSHANETSDSNRPGVPASGASRAPRFRYDDGVAGPAAALSAAVVPTLNIPALPLNWVRIWSALAVAAFLMAVLFHAGVIFLGLQWYRDASWSHGFVVPLISLFIVRTKWDLLKQLPLQGVWIGLPILTAGVIGQVLFRATGVMHMTNLSMLPTLYGAVLFIFGWDHLRILWLPISYLIFMIPPPDPLYIAATSPMQVIAAELGVRLCPLFAVDASRMGTVINVQHGAVMESLQVVEACSGMRMLIAFFALAVALAYTTNRPNWQRVFLAACALPIAILCNALRVTLTAVLVVYFGSEYGHGATHEYLGLLMLGPAFLMQLGVACIIDRIFVEESEDNLPPTAAGVGGSPLPSGGAA